LVYQTDNLNKNSQKTQDNIIRIDNLLESSFPRIEKSLADKCEISQFTLLLNDFKNMKTQYNI